MRRRNPESFRLLLITLGLALALALFVIWTLMAHVARPGRARSVPKASVATVVDAGSTTSTTVAQEVVESLPAESPSPHFLSGQGPATIPDNSVANPGPIGATSDDATLACIRFYEQGDDGYATETGNGFSGAYQFDAPTWAGAVSRAGYPNYAGGPASAAPPYVQDAAAAQLHSERGLQPWPTPAVYCR